MLDFDGETSPEMAYELFLDPICLKELLNDSPWFLICVSPVNVICERTCGASFLSGKLVLKRRHVEFTNGSDKKDAKIDKQITLTERRFLLDAF